MNQQPSRSTMRRVLLGGLVFVALFAVVVTWQRTTDQELTPTPAPTPPVEVTPEPDATPTPAPEPDVGREEITEPGERIPWMGEDLFLLGINYPYHFYGADFGHNNWDDRGVSIPKNYDEVDADFAEMSEMGVPSVRWFVFTDGRSGILFDEDGYPSGLADGVFDDMDAALNIAERHGIYVHFVLLDFMWMRDATFIDGIQMGGYAYVINSPEGQRALIENVFEPLFRRYGSHPYIMTWEVMNEPEWALEDGGDPQDSVSEPSTLDNFQNFVEATVRSIHEHTHSYATVGSASMRWVHNWTGLGLDYYQVHYWDWMQGNRRHDVFNSDYWAFELDRPLVVGEFPADNSNRAELDQFLEHWYAMGFAGAWPWSFRNVDEHGPPDTEVFAEWAWNHSHLVEIPTAGAMMNTR